MVVFGDVVEHLYFTDLSRAMPFYTGQLGFALAEQYQRRSEPGVSAACVVRRGQAIVWLYAAVPELAFPKRATFYVNDVEGLYEEFIRAGVAIERPPQRAVVDEYGGEIHRFSLADPEGNPLEFWQ